MMTELHTLRLRRISSTRSFFKDSSPVKINKYRLEKVQILMAHKIVPSTWTISIVIRTTASMTSLTLMAWTWTSTPLNWWTRIKIMELLMMKIWGSILSNSKYLYRLKRRITLRMDSKRQCSLSLTSLNLSCMRMSMLKMNSWQLQMLPCHMSWGTLCSQSMHKIWKSSCAWKKCETLLKRIRSSYKVI